MMCGCDVFGCWLAGKETSPEQDEMLEYKAPFILPWIVLNKEMAPEQPESFVPFVTGPEGAHNFLTVTVHLDCHLCEPQCLQSIS